jgi:AAA domain
MKLCKLEIEGLRGIPKGWPSIALSDRGLIVYGPNGSGKSSVIDGLEFALGKDSSLYPDARQGVDWDRGGPHIQGGPPEARLFCNHNGQHVDIETLQEQSASWKAAARTSTYVLRRHMLLKFIGSRPADRYTSLETFFNLGEYTIVEGKLQSLKNAAAQVEAGLQSHLTAKSQSARIALGLSNGVAVNTETARTRLADALSEAGLADVVSDLEIDTRKREVEEELQGLVANDVIMGLVALKSHLNGLVATSVYIPIIQQFANFQADLVTALEQSANFVPVELLRAAHSIIVEKHMSECPVCEQNIETASTIASLESRIGSDVKVSSAKTALEQQRQSVLEALSSQLASLRRLQDLWGKAMSVDLPEPYRSEVALLLRLCDRLKIGDIIPDIADVAASLNSTIGSHQSSIVAVDAEIGSAGGARRATLTKVLEVINVIESQLSALESARRHFAEASATRAQLERILSHAVQARRTTVQSIVERLAALANEYYEYVHPNENIAQSSLDVRQVGRGSVDITTSFHGNRESPLLHFSESHLDTLGLCYFLAARKLEADDNPDFKLLILDDVVHSVDAEHRDRIARLIRDKFSDHQLVVVTHDSIFYQRLITILGNQFEHLYFVNWTLEQGPIRIEASTDVDRIRKPELRNASSQAELASASGRFAEWLFRLLTESLHVAVQARFSRPHDLGSLWPPLAAKLRKHKGIGPTCSHTLDRIEANQWVRNKIGAHYNEPESQVTPGEVREFAEGLSDLYQITFCEVCSLTVAKIDDKTCACTCGAIRYAAADKE